MTSNRKQKILELKQKCKTLAALGIDERKHINNSKGDSRYWSWERKREIGAEARIHYIAYGLLRGVPYGIIETKTNDYGDTYAPKLRARHVHELLQKYCIEEEHEFWTQELVSELLCSANKRKDQV